MIDSPKLAGIDPADLPRVAYINMELNDQCDKLFSTVWLPFVKMFEIHCFDLNLYLEGKLSKRLDDLCQVTELNRKKIFMVSVDRSFHIQESGKYLVIGRA